MIQSPVSPVAAKKLWPCAAIFLRYGSDEEVSAGLHSSEQPIVVGSGLCELAAASNVVLFPLMNMVRLLSSGAMPKACVRSMICSPSSHAVFGLLVSTQLKLVPSGENSSTVTWRVWPVLL